MITELEARNFKSWEDTGRLQFAPLTGFFGANSSGKTSILQVLLMLKQTVECSSDWNEPLYFGDEKSLVNLGSFDDVIHRPATDPNLEIFVSWDLPKKRTIQNVGTIGALSFLTRIFRGTLEAFRYVADGDFFEATQSADGEYKISDSLFEECVQSPFRCYGVRGTSTDLMGEFTGFERVFEDLFSQIRYLGPLRQHPRHHYIWDEHPDGVGPHGENAIPALLSGRVQLSSMEEQIPIWLQKLDLIDSYRLQTDLEEKERYELYVTKYKGGPEVHLTDVGFGVSQVLPVLILCYYVQEGSILIIEQPEAHLHPKVQSELGDVLIDVVKNRNIQVILESHSEHLLHRLTRRIAEEEISAKDMALYSCQINEGVSEIEQLKMDEYGNISNWPQNFFGDEMGDLAAKASAEIERRKANK
ncbi:MAG: DUF3696 domain-containing protein [Candidatus Poribacteria bacterium]|nr:DUF3696 domain-containing protein [Candidatus Poribacteria bacterium]